MNQRLVILLVVLGVLVVGLVIFTATSEEPPLEVVTGRIGQGPLIFSFNGEVILEEVKVYQPPREDPDAKIYSRPQAQVYWHLVARQPKAGQEPPEPRPTRALRYGQGMRGLRRAETTDGRVKPLEAGEQYIFLAHADGQEVELTFTYGKR